MVGPTGIEPATHGSLQLQTVHHPNVSEACETTGALSGDQCDLNCRHTRLGYDPT
jgi:hypothetical protein